MAELNNAVRHVLTLKYLAGCSPTHIRAATARVANE